MYDVGSHTWECEASSVVWYCCICALQTKKWVADAGVSVVVGSHAKPDDKRLHYILKFLLCVEGCVEGKGVAVASASGKSRSTGRGRRRGRK